MQMQSNTSRRGRHLGRERVSETLIVHLTPTTNDRLNKFLIDTGMSRSEYTRWLLDGITNGRFKVVPTYETVEAGLRKDNK